jgi:hypothetical protein
MPVGFSSVEGFTMLNSIMSHLTLDKAFVLLPLLGLIPAYVAYSRRLTDNYIHGQPRFTLPDFVGWWVIGTFLFPVAMWLALKNPEGYGSR